MPADQHEPTDQAPLKHDPEFQAERNRFPTDYSSDLDDLGDDFDDDFDDDFEEEFEDERVSDDPGEIIVPTLDVDGLLPAEISGEVAPVGDVDD